VSRCDGGWCRIQHSGPDGWVSANYLVFYRDGGRRGGGNRGGSNNNPDIGFCVDAPNFSFGINCDEGDFGGRPGRPGRSAEVCFYEDFNYRGRSFCARPGQRDGRLSRGWNDRISSIRVEGSASAVVCEDFNYRGRCARVNNSIRRIDGRNNDAISSYRVSR
jgi:hypothetical protein